MHVCVCVCVCVCVEPTALDWLKVRCYAEIPKLDEHLSLLSIHGYRLAIGYLRVVKGGGENHPRFPSEFGGHDLRLCFWISLREVLFSSLGRPAGRCERLQP